MLNITTPTPITYREIHLLHITFNTMAHIKQLIQPNGVEDIADYIKEHNLTLKDEEQYISKDYEYKRCEGGGAYARAPFYIIDGNFYTNWNS